MGLLPNPYVILGLVAFYLVSMGGGMLLAYNRGGDDNEAAHVAQSLEETKTVLADFQNAAKAMSGVAAEFNGVNDDLTSRIATISRDFRNATRATPLPATCFPTPDRVRSLSAAIAAANTAAGLGAGPAVPPSQ